jgi:hypothetical protein
METVVLTATVSVTENLPSRIQHQDALIITASIGVMLLH